MAKRDKLTQRQRRQIAQQHKKRAKGAALENNDNLSEAYQGLLVSRYGEQADIVRLSDKRKFRCYLRQNLGSPVTGDRVTFRLAPDEQGIVETLQPRLSILERPSPHQGLKPVVANINQIFVVIAPLPDFSATLLDRYLVAIDNASIEVIIVANKWDLQSEIDQQNLNQQLDIYRQLGYSVILTSAQSGLGISQLKQAAEASQSILVGQSGVGKSSLINQLFPKQQSIVNEVSSNSRLGQHTTTASQLFLFEANTGFIIDSPGIRDFGLWHMDCYTVAEGFVEFKPFIGGCKFRDCKHINEPGCAIIQAKDNAEIPLQRWQNYCKIVLANQANATEN
ncbi:small ribosomal subunit biogenesis GTPase RsgA [Aliikangiella sp. IMCC44653]